MQVRGMLAVRDRKNSRQAIVAERGVGPERDSAAIDPGTGLPTLDRANTIGVVEVQEAAPHEADVEFMAAVQDALGAAGVDLGLGGGAARGDRHQAAVLDERRNGEAVDDLVAARRDICVDGVSILEDLLSAVEPRIIRFTHDKLGRALINKIAGRGPQNLLDATAVD